MSSKVPSIQSEIFPQDTQWAIAARISAKVFTAIRRQLSKPLRAKGSKVVSGDGGMSALLVFGGSIDEGERSAIALSREYQTPVYILNFNDEACSIRQFEGTRVSWKPGHPAEFLQSCAITAPGYEPLPELSEPRLTIVGVVEDTTLAQACQALPGSTNLFTANSRGVLVLDASGTTTLALSRALGCRSFTIFYDGNKRFWCSVWTSDSRPEECFAIGKSIASCHQAVDTILGETTIDGILRVLDIPPHVLSSAGRVAAEAAGSSIP
jgi:hypothetical protein